MKANNETIPSCVFSRFIRLHDSCLMIPASLASLVDDHNRVMKETNSSPSSFFPVTLNFAKEIPVNFEEFLYENASFRLLSKNPP